MSTKLFANFMVTAAFILAMENGFISGSLIDVDGGGLL